MPAQQHSAAEFLPAQPSLEALRKAASHCRGCDLYRNATQTVFGEGSERARVMLIGEQPGDQEDLTGHPFVGPAGQMLERAMAEVGLPRADVYITNAVKHFKWEPRGKRRIHKKPGQTEVRACRPWLEAEMALVRPQVLICLGVTAASAAFGRAVRLRDYRGVFSASPLAELTFVTTHPSSLLRVRGAEQREQAYRRFVADFDQVCRRIYG